MSVEITYIRLFPKFMFGDQMALKGETDAAQFILVPMYGLLLAYSGLATLATGCSLWAIPTLYMAGMAAFYVWHRLAHERWTGKLNEQHWIHHGTSYPRGNFYGDKAGTNKALYGNRIPNMLDLMNAVLGSSLATLVIVVTRCCLTVTSVGTAMHISFHYGHHLAEVNFAMVNTHYDTVTGTFDDISTKLTKDEKLAVNHLALNTALVRGYASVESHSKQEPTCSNVVVLPVMALVDESDDRHSKTNDTMKYSKVQWEDRIESMDILQTVKGQHATEEVRFHCLYMYYYQNVSKVKLSVLFGKAPSTISDWILQYEEGRGAVRKARVTAYVRHGPERRAWVVGQFQKRPVMHLSEAKSKYALRYPGSTISAASISIIVKEAGLSWKVLERH
ncbi:hypothetical protein BJ741DRAFT_663846 [Chytriomyces cf. hyalinus JEL632]|nr:hypothetical protein BJ741DRAFT_663846 [Chytriomyces cf. hyalinus JEL632]